MTTEIRIAPDQTVSTHWIGEKGRGSLFQCMAGGNCDHANCLDLDGLLEVVICAKLTPFPVPGFTASREHTLEVCRSEGWVAKIFPPDHPIRQRSLGEVRKAMVYECGDSCGGPTDSWLKWLADRAQQATAVA